MAGVKGNQHYYHAVLIHQLMPILLQFHQFRGLEYSAYRAVAETGRSTPSIWKGSSWPEAYQMIASFGFP